MKKKIYGLLSLWLAVMLVFAAMPIAFAEGEGTPATATVKYYTGTTPLDWGDTPADGTITTATIELAAALNTQELTTDSEKTLVGWNLWELDANQVYTIAGINKDGVITQELVGEYGENLIIEPVYQGDFSIELYKGAEQLNDRDYPAGEDLEVIPFKVDTAIDTQIAALEDIELTPPANKMLGSWKLWYKNGSGQVGSPTISKDLDGKASYEEYCSVNLLEPIYKLKYWFTQQPTVENPAVKVNDNKDVTFKWYKAEDNTIVIDKNASAVSAKEDIGLEDSDEISSYNAETGWTPVSVAATEDAGYYHYFFKAGFVQGDVLTVIPSADDVLLAALAGEENYVNGVKNDDGSFVFEVSASETYVLILYSESEDITVKASLPPTLVSEVEGQTTAALTPAAGTYACQATWPGEAEDPVKLVSDTITFTNVTVTFDANGGEGEMDSVTVLAGTKYELPECEFEAPEGMSFKGWKVKETRVETPVITPDGGSFTSTQRVSISCATEGATIYYTTDDSTPTKESTEYITPFSVNEDTTVQAIAYKDGIKESYVESAKFNKQRAKIPKISLVNEDSQKKISITCETEGATIYYTTDDSTPTVESTVYTTPFIVEAGTKITAIACKDGLNESYKKIATFTGKALKITVVPAPDSGGSAGGLGGGTSAGGSVAPTLYAAGDKITVKENIVVSAEWTDELEKVETPVISPSTSEIFNTTAITITCDTEDAIIYYTVNGSDPTTSSARYTKGFLAARTPTTIKAIAVKEGMEDSDIATRQYIVRSISTGSTGGSFGGGYGGGGSSSYTIKFDTNGGLSIANQYVKKNGYVTEPENPTKYGYTFEGWYTDKDLTVPYDFEEKVTSSFTLYAKWSGGGETDPFDDVSIGDWFYDAVIYAYDNGLINGMSDNEYGPAVSLNRAMLVTILYRAEGSPEVTGTSSFTDIEPGAYYEKAVIWAQQNEIVNGMTETEFWPTHLITREQLATILYRYADYKGYLEADAVYDEITAPDAGAVSAWASDAVAYCITSGIINGYEDNTIRPQGNTTRAEAAAMLQRFMEAN